MSDPDPAFLDDPTLLVTPSQIRASIQYERGLVRHEEQRIILKEQRKAKRKSPSKRRVRS